jgi:hypothetical protein
LGSADLFFRSAAFPTVSSGRVASRCPTKKPQTQKPGLRYSLYFPFDRETPDTMFRSFDDFRVFLQSVGFKLIRNEHAREHATLLYKTLVEISFLEPYPSRGYYCLFELGRDSLSLLELKRKTACYHLNELARLAGYDEGLFSDDEFKSMGFDLAASRPGARRCYGHFAEGSDECSQCQFAKSCLEASIG